MKLLKLIRFLPREYVVKYQKDVVDDDIVCYGQIDHRIEEIEIGTSYPIWRQEQTLLHEVLHILDDCHKLELSERQISALAVGLHRLHVENKDFLQE